MQQQHQNQVHSHRHQMKKQKESLGLGKEIPLVLDKKVNHQRIVKMVIKKINLSNL